MLVDIIFLLIFTIHILHGEKEPSLDVSRNYNYDEDLKNYCIVIEKYSIIELNTGQNLT